jgi:superfamily I DNA/RNA helicase
MQLFETKEFDRYLRRLARKGGIGGAVYKEVIKAILLWQRNESPELPRTHHGESRVPHVVKYDLAGHFRLVVYEHAGKRIPLIVGDHEEVEEWLNHNRGRDFTVNCKSKRVQFTCTHANAETTEAAVGGLGVLPAANGPILAKVPKTLLDSLALPDATLGTLNAYATFESVDEDRIWTLLQGLNFPTDDHRQVVMQAIALLGSGREEEARERIELFIGNAKTASENPQVFAEALESGINSDLFVDLGKLSEAEIQRLVGAPSLTDWMLYLHPEQRKLVEREYAGPARVIGISGSGKTSLLVHRANHLAKKYKGECILVLSLNGALCKLIAAMLDALCEDEVRRRIKVMTIYDFCYQAVKAIEPERLIEKRDPRSGEDLATCWRDFMRKKHAQKIAGPVVDALDCRPYFDSHAYVLEELIWIRSGFGREDRDQYLSCNRYGRGIPFPGYDPATAQKPRHEAGGAMPFDARSRLLKLLAEYEEYMAEGGLLDFDGVSLEAFSLRHRIREHDALRARCVLVDEVQDCSTVELAVIAEIPTSTQDGLYLTGDPVQKVFPKQHEPTQAGINIVGRSALLRVNYRNTRQILETAFQIIRHFGETAPVARDEILEPDYAFRQGSRPSLYECDSRQQQIDLIVWFLSLLSADDFDSTCIGSPTEPALQEMEAACEARGLPTFRITGETSRTGMIGKGIKLSLLPELKGYEFRQVFLVDLMDSQLLPRGMAWEERWRIAFQLYVAMTRARDDLIMSFVQNCSTLLQPLWESLEECKAGELLEANR